MIISSQTSSDQFAFGEGDKITFKTYGKKKFIHATINQVTDSLLIYHKNKFSEIFSVVIDSISAVKKIKGTHVFARTLSALAIPLYVGIGVAGIAGDDPTYDGRWGIVIVPALILSIPWLIPARVLYIGNKYKIEVSNE